MPEPVVIRFSTENTAQTTAAMQAVAASTAKIGTAAQASNAQIKVFNNSFEATTKGLGAFRGVLTAVTGTAFPQFSNALFIASSGMGALRASAAATGVSLGSAASKLGVYALAAAAVAAPVFVLYKHFRNTGGALDQFIGRLEPARVKLMQWSNAVQRAFGAGNLTPDQQRSSAMNANSLGLANVAANSDRRTSSDTADLAVTMLQRQSSELEKQANSLGEQIALKEREEALLTVLQPMYDESLKIANQRAEVERKIRDARADQVKLTDQESQDRISLLQRTLSMLTASSDFGERKFNRQQQIKFMEDEARIVTGLLISKERQIELLAQEAELTKEIFLTTERGRELSKEQGELFNRNDELNRSIRDKKRQDSPGAAFGFEFREWQDGLKNWGNTAKDVFGAVNSGIDTLAAGLTNAALVTGEWGKAFAQVGQQIIGTLVQIGVKMLVIGVLSAFLPGGSFLGGLFGKAIGFEEGGFTGPGARNKPAGIVHAGEYVIPAHMVQAHGLSNIERQFGGSPATRYSQPSSGYQSGGFVSPTTGTGVNVSVGFINTRQAAREEMRRSGTKIVIDALRDRSNTVRA